MTEETKVPFEQQVWDKLSRIDVSEHSDRLPKTGKRPEITYLAWHRAWMLVKRAFPATTYSHRPDLIHQDGTVEVEVDVIISYNGTETMFTNARLAVMDNWFNPINNPTARQINDSRQRALVKALAFAGLGLNLWGDDVVPVGVLNDPITDDQLALLEELVEKSESDREKFLKWCEVERLEDLPFERFRSARGLLEAKIRRLSKEKDDE
jgi:hypothetical protein